MTRVSPADVVSPQQAELNAAIYEPPVPIERSRALRIKERIEGYWRERGYTVDVRIGDDGAVESNLVISGQPE